MGTQTKLSRFTIFWIKLGRLRSFGTNLADLQYSNPNLGIPYYNRSQTFGLSMVRPVSNQIRPPLLQVNLNKLFIYCRGNSKYHYYGIRVKPSSPLISTPAPDEGVLAGRGAGQTPGHKRYKMMQKSESPGDCIPEHNHSQVLFLFHKHFLWSAWV